MKRLFLLISFLWQSLFFAQTSQQDLARAKAQYIYSFVNYIEWPNFDQLKEFKIGLLGADQDLINAMNSLAAKKLIMQLPIKVLTFNEYSDLKTLPATEILYVNAANFKNFDITKVKKNVLVVSYNQPDIYRSMVSFMVVDNKLQLAFNHYLTKKAGFYVHEDFKNQASVYIEDPNQAKKNKEAQDQWVNTVEKNNQQELAKIKAQSIYNFVNYIEWPNIDQAKEFKIGLLGADPDLINALNDLAAKKLVMQLPIKVIPYADNSVVKKLPQSEILYVDAANFKNFEIDKVKKNVLVVSYNEPDLYRSMISFMVVDKKLQFAFNSILAKKAELDIHEDFKTLASVYIEDADQTKKNQQANEKWGSAVEKIIGKLQQGDNETVLSNAELLEVAKKLGEQQKSITEQKEKINIQMLAFQKQEDSLKRQKAKLSLATAQNKIQEANIIEQKERIDNQLNAILTQEGRLKLQEEKLNLTIAQNKIQEDELRLKKAEMDLQQNKIAQQSEILTTQKTEMELQETKLLKQLEKINAQQTIIWLSVIAAIAIFLSLGLVYRNYKKSKKTNVLLEQQKNEIQHQKTVIEEKHREITDSIHYAERIQKTFLASTQLLNDNLKDYFVFYQPKDVVSGDFYWATKLSNGKMVLVVGDSTGHGVPGAIMSLINITSLERALENNSIPSEVLNETRKTVIQRLKNDGSTEGGWDGMDCAMMFFDFESKIVEYVGAFNPLWIIRKNELLEFAPDKMPVGRHHKGLLPFTSKTIKLESGDIIYAFTDGMPDQFGGPNWKKFTHKQFKELLLSIWHLPMATQNELIKDAINNWRSNRQQTDDITVFGIKI